MTRSTADRPQMLVEEFEELARHAPESARLEFLNGKIGVKPMPDGNHAQIVAWLLKRCMQYRPELFLFPEQGLQVQAYRKGGPGRTERWRPRSTSPERASGPSPRVS